MRVGEAPRSGLTIDANETLHFNSNDLEQGNYDNGLSGGTGAPGQGDWRLELTSDLDIEVLAYIRTGDGFLTAIHDVVEQGLIGSRVAIFNPGRNKNQVSLMWLINPGTVDAEVTITGIDDAGTASGRDREVAGAVRVSVPAGGARTVPAISLESATDRAVTDMNDGDPNVVDTAVLDGELCSGTGK